MAFSFTTLQNKILARKQDPATLFDNRCKVPDLYRFLLSWVDIKAVPKFGSLKNIFNFIFVSGLPNDLQLVI
ncbi:unnamed protein product [Clonostachys rosea]|uniref:Uncharacterized protein n=1 Tax=Bionectria ochroleuca TaxID=29856 RepID=A0ABY6TWF0_BIOOC|nr:unnamed protein product [Clonostachys rosea]